MNTTKSVPYEGGETVNMDGPGFISGSQEFAAWSEKNSHPRIIMLANDC